VADSGIQPSTIRAVWADVVAYVLRRPSERTHVSARSAEERGDYDARILQRLNISVSDYAVLNIHRVGIDAPVSFVTDMVGQWRPDAGYWPNDLARAVFGGSADGRADHVEVFLLGRARSFFGLPRHVFGLDYIPLFRMDIIRRQRVPLPMDVDNARYILYRCTGGYPIGIFSMYVRSNIASLQERERTQLFFVVSFDFFGRKNWLGARAVRPLWEWVHNRVTAHTLTRFRAHCEAAFARLEAGALEAEPRTVPQNS